MPKLTSQYWRDEALARRRDGMKPSDIELALDRMVTEDPALEIHGRPPRERTIRGFEVTPEEEEVARWLRWPDSLGASGLPCEASAAVLELLRHYFDHGTRRPTVRTARWYWKLRLAVGGNGPPPEKLADLAGTFAALEQLNGAVPVSALEQAEAVLAYRVWEPGGEDAYQRALGRGFVPELRPIRITLTNDAADAGRVLDELFPEEGDQARQDHDAIRSRVAEHISKPWPESLQAFGISVVREPRRDASGGATDGTA